MASNKYILTILSIIFSSANCFRLELYDEVDFDGFFWESSSVSQCTDIPSVGVALASSLKTDACIMVYRDAGCKSYSIKIPAGEHQDLSVFKHARMNFDNAVSSYHLCNESIGGDKIQIGLKGFHDGARKTLVEYSNVCGCINPPKFTHGIVDSLDNNGNCVKLYTERDCQGSSIELAGGVSAESMDLAIVGFDGTTKSLGMCSQTAPCIKLNATVYKFILNTNSSKVRSMAIPGEVDMAATTTFRNNGSATVSQEYAAKKIVKEFYEVTRVKTMTEMHKVDLDLGVTYEFNAGVPIVAQHKVIASLGFAYDWEKNTTESESEKYTREDEREFVANQRIEIAPCSMYRVNSFVKTYQKYPVDYEILTLISGEMGTRRMMTNEIKERVTSMEYVGDYDDHTIIAKSYGSMTADFGLEAVIDGEGDIIEGCRQNNKYEL